MYLTTGLTLTNSREVWPIRKGELGSLKVVRPPFVASSSKKAIKLCLRDSDIWTVEIEYISNMRLMKTLCVRLCVFFRLVVRKLTNESNAYIEQQRESHTEGGTSHPQRLWCICLYVMSNISTQYQQLVTSIMTTYHA